MALSQASGTTPVGANTNGEKKGKAVNVCEMEREALPLSSLSTSSCILLLEDYVNAAVPGAAHSGLSPLQKNMCSTWCRYSAKCAECCARTVRRGWCWGIATVPMIQVDTDQENF